MSTPKIDSPERSDTAAWEATSSGSCDQDAEGEPAGTCDSCTRPEEKASPRSVAETGTRSTK